MACGVPAVVTNFGDNGQWVRPGGNGFLFPIGDHDALAEAIGRLLDDPSLRTAFATRSRDLIVQRYKWTTEMSRMERLYRELAASSRAAAR